MSTMLVTSLGCYHYPQQSFVGTVKWKKNPKTTNIDKLFRKKAKWNVKKWPQIRSLFLFYNLIFRYNGKLNLFLNGIFECQCVKISMPFVPLALHILCDSGEIKQVSNNDMPWHKIPFEVRLNWAENNL